MKEYLLEELYDGNFYHITTEGLEEMVVVREEEDFFVARNYLALSAWKAKVDVVAFSIMSNHFHLLVACKRREYAENYIRIFKQVYSTYLHNKYGMHSSLRGSADGISLIHDLWYLRNCIAYILRNPICARLCSKVEDYLWSSYKAYFTCVSQTQYSVATLKGRRKRRVLRTRMDLTGCPYMVDADGNVTLESFVRYDIVEKAFRYSGKYFLYQLGCCNDARMEYELVVRPHVTSNDKELLLLAQKCAEEHYRGKNLSDLTSGEKCAMLKNLFFNNKTTVAQLARVLGLARSLVRKILSS